MQDVLQELGAAVKARRSAMQLSQEQLAERCGFDRTYISMLERGVRNPSLTNLVKLAHGLEVPLAQLFEVCDGA